MNYMGKYPVWGISKWREFEQCPRMYHAKNVAKRWRETPNDAMVRGKTMHKGLEDSIKYNIELPDDLQHMNPIIEGILARRAAGCAVYPEMKFGVGIRYDKVDFFDGADLRARFVLDVFMQQGWDVDLIDWKTGKRKSEHEEDARYYAAFTHCAFAATKTTAHYVYIDCPGESFSETLEPNEANKLRVAWWKKFEFADQVVSAENVPATPCNACRWCGDWTCPHNKNDKIK